MRSLLPVIDAGLPTGIVEPFAERTEREQVPLRRAAVRELQVNLGKLCNQTCTHCHVDAGPTKTRENMNRETARRVLDLALACGTLETVDLTGGAPELNPHFRDMVQQLRAADVDVIDRCNLTILSEPGHEDTAAFLAQQGVIVIASLPCYLSENVDKQRGRGVFDRSIEGLQKLNALGYGHPDSGLRLDLVFNPTGAQLPPDQSELQRDYQRELAERFGIRFNALLTITNMPIKRFGKQLHRSGQLSDYMRLLADRFNPEAARKVMCRSLVSVGWDGTLYDCDFNQMLELPAGRLSNSPSSEPPTVWTIDSLDAFANTNIVQADHCYGCTAGSGSSCSGSVV